MVTVPHDVPTVRPEYDVSEDALDALPVAPALFRFACLDPNAARREGLYVRRVVRADGASCVQVILFYRVQWVPYHRNDFAPFFVYLDANDALTRIVYDVGHHRAATLLPHPDLCLTVVAPWHALRPGRTALARRLRATELRLTDDVIRAWWYEPRTEAQLKLRSKLVDPWHPGLQGIGREHGTFRDEAACPRCGRPALMDDMEVRGPDLVRPTRCPVGHPFVAAYRGQRMAVEGALT